MNRYYATEETLKTTGFYGILKVNLRGEATILPDERLASFEDALAKARKLNKEAEEDEKLRIPSE